MACAGTLSRPRCLQIEQINLYHNACGWIPQFTSTRRQKRSTIPLCCITPVKVLVHPAPDFMGNRLASMAAKTVYPASVNEFALGGQSAAASGSIARAVASMHAAGGADHNVLGTRQALDELSEVRMYVFGKCKMGISFWPTFRFKAPDRDAQPGSVKLVPARTTCPGPIGALAQPTAPGSSTSSQQQCESGHEQPQQANEQLDNAMQPERQQSLEAQVQAQGRQEADASLTGRPQLLYMSFTKDPPDEFSLGANFLGGIPFPFITIRTQKLEGTLDPSSGAVTLLFEASFNVQVGKRPPTSLVINATLTTEAARAYDTVVQGHRLESGRGVLVSAAEVPKTPNWFANLILWLPTAATAKLPVRFEFT